MLLSQILKFIKQQQDIERATFPENSVQGRVYKTFPWEQSAMEQYVSWAFVNDYLLVSFNCDEIDGITIAYLLNKPSNGTVESMFPSSDEIKKEDEHTKEIAVMDTIFKTKSARISIFNKFKQRYPNWENQKKVGNRKGIPVTLENKYFKLISNI